MRALKIRKYKFRGKHTNKGEMIYGDLIQDVNRGLYYIFPFDKQKFPEESISVIPESVGEFTGLYDKNGKEIYEGDILMEKFGFSKPIYLYYVCEFKNSGFCFRCINSGDDDIVLNKSEVVSNKFENPELLKEAEENE